MAERKSVAIYVHGVCPSSPGAGGYGIVFEHQGKRKEASGGYRYTSANRMELMAAIAALEALKQPCDVTVFTESEYVANGMSKGWAQRWQSNGWVRSDNGKAANSDLWERLLQAATQHRAQFEWQQGPELAVSSKRASTLSAAAADGNDLARDEAYERRWNIAFGTKRAAPRRATPALAMS